MALVKLNEVSFAYPDHPPTLSGLNAQFEEGSLTIIAGPSGCGKTTLLRLLKKEIQPHGRRRGDIFFEKKKIEQLTARESAESIGWVAQDPENQAVMDEVRQELAFCLENVNVSPIEIRKRIAEIAYLFGMEDWMERPIHTLSGGQKQKMHLASALVLRPKLLLLDEPTAQLDPIAAKELIHMLRQLNEEFGITIVIAEHRLDELFPIANQIILLDHGAIQYSGPPEELVANMDKKRDKRFFPFLPAVSQLALRLDPEGPVPLTVKEGQTWFETFADTMTFEKRRMDGPTGPSGDLLMKLERVTFQYDRNGPFILNRLGLDVCDGDFLAIFGGNGSGKSTLLQIMAGLRKPQKGRVTFRGKPFKFDRSETLYQEIGYLAQNPMLHFLYDTTRQELDHTLRQFGARAEKDEQAKWIARLGIESLLDRHPYDCSGGEKQKIALATVLLGKPRLLLLDEPTKGLDPDAKRELGQILRELHQSGIAIVIVTHDLTFAAEYATRCAMLFQGEVSAIAEPKAFFRENYFYTTSIHRVVRKRLPDALTKEEVFARCAPNTSSS